MRVRCRKRDGRGTEVTRDPSQTPDGDHARDDERRVGELIRLVGTRPAVSAERAARVKAAVRERWRAETVRRARSRRLRIWAAAAAAVLLAAVTIGGLRLFGPDPGVGATPAATVERLTGPAWLRPPGSTELVVSTELREGDPVAAGSAFSTDGGSRAALRLPSGHSVRLDNDTSVRFVAPRVLSLERGALYVDSDRAASAASAPVEIRTPYGTAREIGTQFELRLVDSALRVRVREGAVELRGALDTVDARAGDEVTVDSEGRLSRGEIPSYGPAWSWVARVAPVIEIDGRPLGSFLDWAAREGGWTVRLDDAGAERAAREVTLSGSIQGLSVEEALEAVLPTCRMTHRIDEGALVVETSTGDPE
jgi:ferric-dicitrate binding protein FerR (iron transport regulator)